MKGVTRELSSGSLEQLSDEALVAAVVRVSRAHRALTAELVLHLAEMDARKLYLTEATSSMFVYCVRRLGFSEDEACRRIDAARAVRKWPVILDKIASGELTLTALGKLKPFLTNENANDLVEAVSGKSVREIERILATRFPRPDMADSIRKLPERNRKTTEEQAAVMERAEPKSSGAFAAPPTAVESESGSESESRSESELGSESESGSGLAPRPIDRGKLQPLSAERIQVKFTASRELEEKISLARDLMSHRNSRGDLATVFEAGLDLLIAQLSKKKLGQTKRKQRKVRLTKTSRVTNQTRREVVDRDGLGCSFVNAKGERCGARAFLEFDHRRAKGKGGGQEPENIRLLCRGHNQAEAERVYGKEHMERSRRKGSSDVRERVSTHEFVVGFGRPRRRGYSSSAGRSTGTDLLPPDFVGARPDTLPPCPPPNE